MATEVDVRLLGPFELSYQGELISLGETRARAFLALLALEAGRPLTFGQIIPELWLPRTGESLESEWPSAGSVHRLRSDLRKELPSAVDALVTKDASGYKLAVGGCDVDAGRFAYCDIAGDAARAADPEAALTSWQRALDQWRGRAALIGLARTDLGTITARAAGLQERRVNVAVKQSELRLALGADGREVSNYLGELRTHHSNHVGLLELYGRTLAICGQADDARNVLARTFVQAGPGSPKRVPTTRVRELLERIRSGETESLRPPPPTGARRTAPPSPASPAVEMLIPTAGAALTPQQPDDSPADVSSATPEPPVKPTEVSPEAGPDRQPAGSEGRWLHHLSALWLPLLVALLVVGLVRGPGALIAAHWGSATPPAPVGAPTPPPMGVPFLLRSANFPDSYLVVVDGGARLQRVTSSADRDRSALVLVPGLAGRGVTIRQARGAGLPLRHRLSFVMAEEQRPKDPTYKDDATFWIDTRADAYGFRFRSEGFPGRYLRHSDSLFWVESMADRPGTPFLEDSTFTWEPV